MGQPRFRNRTMDPMPSGDGLWNILRWRTHGHDASLQKQLYARPLRGLPLDATSDRLVKADGATTGLFTMSKTGPRVRPLLSAGLGLRKLQCYEHIENMSRENLAMLGRERPPVRSS
jgi:hypothetical protein